jgi:hypothetical protein
MEVINRAATDPNVDVDKMERLLGMYERISERNAKVAFHTALAEMQPKLPIITERGEIKHGQKLISKYALWEDINEAIRPTLHAHGFALSFRTARDNTQVTITAILSHREGHVEETTLTLDADNSGSKNAVQAVGSSISYGQRYAAVALLNITTQGKDDDGEQASDNRKRDYGPDEPVMGALNKTRLDAALRAFCGELDACEDEDSLIAFLNGEIEYTFPRGSKTKEKVSVPDLLSQTQKDLPSWWWTKEGSDALGIRDRIEERKRVLRPNPDDPRSYKD